MILIETKVSIATREVEILPGTSILCRVSSPSNIVMFSKHVQSVGYLLSHCKATHKKNEGRVPVVQYNLVTLICLLL